VTALFPNGLTTQPVVTAKYGWRTHPIFGTRMFHYGVDSVGHPSGMNYAPIAGVVTFAAYNGGAGNRIDITGPLGDIVRLKHNAHLNWVRVGMKVALGQALAPTGTTGDSTGIHCHTEVAPHEQHGSTVEPYGWIRALLPKPGGAGVGATPIPPSAPSTSQESTMRLALDPTRSKPGNNVFVVVGNGAPYDFPGDQTLANAMAKVHGATYTPTTAQWPTFLAACTPAPVGDVSAVIRTAIVAAFDDVEIPTPSISAEDRQAIADAAGEAARKALGTAISNG
jgi:hypothetical protein